MKQYYITSLYTDATQVAIQQDHACKEVFKNVLKDQNSTEFSIFMDYINNFKTTVALGVGHPTQILQIYSYMMKHKDSLNIPIGLFQEDSLNKTATCLSFVATEKLCANIHYSIGNMLKEFKVRNLFGLTQIKDCFPTTYICPVSNISIRIDEEVDSSLSFKVSYKTTDVVEMQNTELMPINLEDEDTIEELYQQYNPEDAAFYNNIENNNSEKDSTVLKEFEYSLEELNFLLMIKSLRLK